MILGPNDPSALTGADLEAAREHTALWNQFLGISLLSPQQQAEKDALLATVLDIIGYGNDDEDES